MGASEVKPQPTASSALTEGQRLGAYRIVRLLGEGGMGAVYEARQEPLDRRVALKTLHADYAKSQDALARFFNEAKVLSRLEHPSIVQVSDFGTTDDGTAYLVMEYLRGQSLGRRIRTVGEQGERLPLLTALQLCFQIADVLAVAHAQGIVHRDLKPENLMLVADPIAPGGERVKLLDFGIAKLTNGHEKGGVKTATHQVMGTPAYMSPEQCSGAGGVDARTDVYALGCVLYEVLTGRPPFIAEGAGQLIGMHLFQEPPPLLSLAPKVPQTVSAFVHRLLTKDKTLRPSMSEAADQIAKLLSKIPGGGPMVRSRPQAVTDPDATRPLAVVPHVTTLGKSIGQQVSDSSRSRYLLAAGVVFAGGIGLFLMQRTIAPPIIQDHAVVVHATTDPAAEIAPKPVISAITPPMPTAPMKDGIDNPTKAANRREILWKIESVPPGCSVFDEKGRLFGDTPLALLRSSEPGTLVLWVRKPGYVDAKLNLHRDQSEEKQITLIQRAPPVESARPPQKKNTSAPQSSTPPPSFNKRIGYEP